MTAKNSKTYLGYLNKSVDEQKQVYSCWFFFCVWKSLDKP